MFPPSARLWKTILRNWLNTHSQRRRTRRRRNSQDRASSLVELLETRTLLAADFGDAPDTGFGPGPGNYNTLASDNGPSHQVSSSIFLGATVDGELDATPNLAANGDDVHIDLFDDEDGLNNPGIDLTVTVGSQPTVNVIVTNSGNTPAMLYGWIDTNADGVFSNADERASFEVPADTNGEVVPLRFPTVAAGFTGTTYARFRIGSSTDAAAANPYGAALAGEVEDYVAEVVLPSTGRVADWSTLEATFDPFHSPISIGDLNGDGIDDWAVGGKNSNDPGNGAVYIMFRDADGQIASTTWIASGVGGLDPLNEGDVLGRIVTSLGDLDGDGVTDLATTLGVRQYLEGEDDKLGIQILFLNTDGTVKDSRRIDGFSTNPDDAIDAMAAIGDVDGDGVVDLAVSRTKDTTPVDSLGRPEFYHFGAINVLFLNTDGTVKDSHKILNNQAEDWNSDIPVWTDFAYSIATVGDMNGDGIPDLAVGGPGVDFDSPIDDWPYYVQYTDTGAVYILFLNDNGTVKDATRIEAEQGGLGTLPEHARFGTSITNIGDLNGDGITDLAVGAIGDGIAPDFEPDNFSTGDARGFVYILYMNAEGTVDHYEKIGHLTNGFGSLEENDLFGGDLSNLGDVNGDGVIDLAVRAWGTGETYILHFEPERPGDLADAPDSGPGTGTWNYNTTLTDDGPVHIVDPNIYLGSTVSKDLFAAQSTAADGDDDDGVVTPLDDVVFSETPSIDLRVTNLTGQTATLYGWIDLNLDGVFDNSEQASIPVLTGTQDGIVTLTFPSVPSSIAGTTYARFRLSTDGAAALPTGEASDGEVEDYLVKIAGPTGIGAEDIVRIPDPPYRSDFGNAVAWLGDLDGDGVDDLAVGYRNEKKVSILLMDTNDSVKSRVDLTSPIYDRFDSFGRSVTSLGDLDGDGITDIAVGASAEQLTSGVEAGTLHVIFLNADGTEKSRTVIGNNTAGGPGLIDGNGFGTSVTAIGDVDGDGVVDLAVGATSNETTTTRRGTVYVLFMNTDGTVRDSTLIGSNTGGGPALASFDYFGTSVAPLGDWDDDGIPDLVVGARGRDVWGTTISDDGAVALLMLNSDGTVREYQWVGRDAGIPLSAGDEFGSSVAALGDLDGNGVTDLAVGAWRDDTGGTDNGAVYILQMNDDGSVKSTSKIAEHLGGGPDLPSRFGFFGVSVAAIPIQDEHGLPLLDEHGIPVVSGDDLPELAVGGLNGVGDDWLYLLHLTDELPDYGDAPLPTAANEAPPSHGLDPNLFLGLFVDGEPGAQTNATATGDDVAGALSDENGLVDPSQLSTFEAGAAPVVDLIFTNTSGQAATLYGWIDFNRNGVFDLAERAELTVADGLVGEIVTLSFPVVADALEGTTYARFRLSTDSAAAAPTGPAADGEVEDYRTDLTILDTDLGDAPDTSTGTGPGNYNTLASDGGPAHIVHPDVYLGSGVTVESDATARDNFDDGLVDPADLTLIAGGAAPTVDIRVTNQRDTDATLFGWIDYNGDGVFDSATEAASLVIPAGTSTSVVTLTFPDVPENTEGITYARFRLTTDLAVTEATGAANDGEVEDYLTTILSRDFGDAPISYGTFASEGGPSHLVVDGLFLGNSVDRELDGVPSPKANGDDVVSAASPGDEDGLIDPEHDLAITFGVAPSVRVSVTNTTGLEATLYGWIDLNGDGSFDNATERASITVPDGTLDGEVTLSFPEVPLGVPGTTFARFRLSTDLAAADPTGAASDGEVEDYLVNVLNLDYGDAPDAYNTLSASGGPVHNIDPLLYLGGGVDSELDGQPTVSASGDNLNGTLANDEDGLIDPAVDLKLTTGYVPKVRATVTNLTGRDAFLHGWIDLNGDGVFDNVTERRSVGIPADVSEIQVALFFPSVGETFIGTTYARFRLSSDPAAAEPTGAAFDGEVEDYVVTIEEPGDGTAPPSTELSVGSVVKLGAGTPNLSLEEGDGFGQAVAAIGDLDDDGVPDLAVSLSKDDRSASMINLLFMNTDGTVRERKPIDGTTAGISISNEASFGHSIAALGDLNGDLIPDLAVGAPGDDGSAENDGSLHLLFLNRDGTVKGSHKIVGGDFYAAGTSLVNGYRFGKSVAAVGDLDGDNVIELAVGTNGVTGQEAGRPSSGEVQILFMNTDGTVKDSSSIPWDSPGLDLPMRQAFAISLAGIGDMNGDGTPDLAVGSWHGYTGVQILFMNSAGGFDGSARIAWDSPGMNASSEADFGWSLAVVGDLDNDNVDDLVIGSPHWANEIHIAYMNADGTVKNSSRISRYTPGLGEVDRYGYFGWSVTSLGDFNGDGSTVLAVSAILDDGPSDTVANAGAVYLLNLEGLLTPATIDGAVASLPASPPEGGFQIETAATTGNLVEWVDAIGDLPAFPRPNELVTITLNLEEGDYPGDNIFVPSGYRLVINGANGSVVFRGASPALTVVSGDVLVLGNVTFTNATDAPTILVQGGSLTLRGSRVEETTTADRPAIEVLGGTVDLGTAADPGGNTIVIRGDGDLIHNTGSNPVLAIGNTYFADAAAITSPFDLEAETLDALDGPGVGLVSYFADQVFLTIDEGPHEFNLLTLTADLNLTGASFAVTSATNGSAVTLADETTARFTALDDGAADFSYSVAVDGQLIAQRAVSFNVNNVAPIVDLGADRTVPEGSLVSFDGTFSDPGAGDTHTYLWQVSASNGQVIADGTSQAFSFTPSDDGIYTVTYTVTDDDGGVGTAMVNVVVENQSPTAQDAQWDLVENAPVGTVVGTISATDPGDDTLSYSITGGTGATAFAIDAATGQVTVADSTQIDFETTPSLSLDVEVSDEDGAAVTATVTIYLLNQASITGTVFVDANQNGLIEANEMGIDGVTVELLDGDGALVATTLTSLGGYYQFEDHDPGTYRIRQVQPTGVADGAESLGSLGGTIVENDVMELTLDRTDGADYDFAEIGQSVGSGDTATIGFWQNKHGQALIAHGGSPLAMWLTDSFGNVFGNEFVGASGDDVARFYKEQLFKQKAIKSAGPAKVDAQFMAVALATYFTSNNLAGTVAADYGFNVTDTGISTKIVNVGTNGAAFGVSDNTDLTILQLLLATNAMTDVPDAQSGFAYIYDQDGNGVIDAAEALRRSMANDVFSLINEQGSIA